MASVSLDSHTPWPGSTLTATATKADPESDPVTLTFVWRVNGVIKQTTSSSTSLTDTFNLVGNANSGDTISVEVTPDDGMLLGTTAADAATVSGPAVPPTVTNVVVSSTNWNSTCLSYLASLGSQNVGGYSIPVQSGAELLPLPWINLNQIKVTFSENVVVNNADLALWGVNVSQYDIAHSNFVYDPTACTATWTLPAGTFLDSDKLMLELNADGMDPIHDSAGDRLDGEWTNPASTTQSSSSAYPSGNGTAGGNFLFRFNVLSGDANQDGAVGLADMNTVLANYGKSGTTWGQGDFTGDGVVGLADLNTVLTKYGTVLPSREPTAQSFPAAALSVAAVVPTAVCSASAISVAPVTTVDTPAASTINGTNDRVAIVSSDVVASGQVAVPTTFRGIEAAVPAIAIASRSAAVGQPAHLASESQPVVLRSLSAPVSPGQATVTAAASPTTSPGTPLTLNDLRPVVSEATARWANAGLNVTTLQKLARVPFVIGDLSGASLGEAAGNRIDLDTDVAGNGWLVDSTPARSETFTPSQNNRPLPTVDPRVVDRMDLATVVENELGHSVGSNGPDALTDDIMSSVPGTGIRRNAVHTDAALAS